MRKILVLMVVMVIVTAACRDSREIRETDYQGTGPTEIQPAGPYQLSLEKGPANLGQLKMNLDRLGPFHGRFVLQFEGQTEWSYQVDTRSDGTNVEYQLTIQGVESGQDLGDVRLVNSKGNNFMIGPGTGDLCVQFPDAFETEPLFLGPADFIDLTAFTQPPGESRREVLQGRETEKNSTFEDDYQGWKDVQVLYWLDLQTEAVLRYEFQAVGNDPLYEQGDGRIRGVFEVLGIAPQQIDAIPGCVIEFPLPDDASSIIRFPGLISFITSRGPVKLEKFYTRVLEADGWSSAEPQINSETRESVLEFSNQNQSVIIHGVPLNPQDFSQGYRVEIFLDE